MILGFKEQFNKSILDGTKIHSIRAGKRWKAGIVIHFYNHIRTKQMTKFKLGVCVSVQNIEIVWRFGIMSVCIDGRILGLDEIVELTKNDGFKQPSEFTYWFDKNLKGQIIHWTNFRY